MKILFFAHQSHCSMSGWQRAETLRALGHEVVVFEKGEYERRRNRFQNWLCGPFDRAAADTCNRDLLRALDEHQPDVAWLEWPKTIARETIEEARKRLPGCTFVCFQDDNPFGTRAHEQSSWERFLDAVPAYDLHLVKRTADRFHFRAFGARRVELFEHGIVPELFHPVPPEARFQSEVSFVGTPHDHRVGVISALLLEEKLPVRVYGNGWNRRAIYYRRRAHFRAEVVGEDYVSVICGSRICLGFVSSSNRDEYTLRSFEIPACKGFLLAERTPKHLELYEEGVEAEFFDSTAECADKIRFYLGNETARARIAEAGFQRGVRCDYSLRRRMTEALERLEPVEALCH